MASLVPHFQLAVAIVTTELALMYFLLASHQMPFFATNPFDLYSLTVQSNSLRIIAWYARVPLRPLPLDTIGWQSIFVPP